MEMRTRRPHILCTPRRLRRLGSKPPIIHWEFLAAPLMARSRGTGSTVRPRLPLFPSTSRYGRGGGIYRAADNLTSRQHRCTWPVTQSAAHKHAAFPAWCMRRRRPRPVSWHSDSSLTTTSLPRTNTYSVTTPQYFLMARNIRRILVRPKGVNTPLPPEAKKILKIWLRSGSFWSIWIGLNMWSA